MTTIEEFDPTDPSDLFDSPFDVVQTPVAKARVSLSPQEAFVRTAKVFAPAGAGLVLIWFGLTSTGSYFSPVSRFGGVLSDVFYGLQLGNLLAMIGVVLVYDSIKRSGYL